MQAGRHAEGRQGECCADLPCDPYTTHLLMGDRVLLLFFFLLRTPGMYGARMVPAHMLLVLWGHYKADLASAPAQVAWPSL